MYPEKMRNRYVGDDLMNRVHGTYARYQDVPYYVSVAGGKFELYSLPVNTGSMKAIEPVLKVPFDNPDLDISSIELGYYNQVWHGKDFNKPQDWKPRVFFTYRDPQKRTYRQGICDANVIVCNIDGKHSGMNVSYSDHGFANLLKNVYPSFAEAQVILDEAGEVALSKETALQKTKLGIIFVYHRGEQVGYITPDDKKLRLKKTGSSWVFRKFLSCYPWKLEDE